MYQIAKEIKRRLNAKNITCATNWGLNATMSQQVAEPAACSQIPTVYITDTNNRQSWTRFFLTSLTVASVGLADPAIYKNKPILNRLIEHYNVPVLTLVTAQELQMCTNVLFVNRIEPVKALAHAPLPSAGIWTWGEAQQWSSRSMSSVPLVAPNYYTSDSLRTAVQAQLGVALAISYAMCATWWWDKLCFAPPTEGESKVVLEIWFFTVTRIIWLTESLIDP